MKKNRNILGLAILMITLIISCGKMPQAEMDAAKAALDSLKAHGANLILPDEFDPLQKNLDDALALVNVQNSKTFKSFGEAKEKLVTVASDAAALEGKNTEKKAELMKKIDDLMEEVSTLNNDSKNRIPKTGNVSTTLRMLQKDAYAIDSALEEIKTMIEENDLIAALEKLEEVKEEAGKINSDVKAAATASRPAAKPRTTTTTTGQMGGTKR